MRQGFADFLLKRLMLLFQFRKMRLIGHVGCLLVRLLPDEISLHQLFGKSTRHSLCGAANPPNA